MGIGLFSAGYWPRVAGLSLRIKQKGQWNMTAGAGGCNVIARPG